MKKNEMKFAHGSKLYLAAPLFSEAELKFNSYIASILKRHFHVYLPQEDGELLDEAVKRGEDVSAAKKRIFANDVKAIQSADILFIILDGRTVDEGAAFELGVAFSFGKVCIALQTDPRRLLIIGNNPMISESLQMVFDSTISLEEWVYTLSSCKSFSLSTGVGESSPCSDAKLLL